MQLTAEVNGVLYLYEENFWTGKKSLTANGVPLPKIGKKQFSVTREDGTASYITVKGNFLSGVSLLMPEGEFVLVKNKWYDWVLIFLPLVGIVVGVAGCGAIGGGLSALFGFLGAFVNATLLRSKLSMPVKIPLCIVVFAVANVVWFLLYLVIANAILDAVAGILPNIL